MFQFLYGTIKSYLDTLEQYGLPPFQFLYGTIKRVFRWNPKMSDIRFNSSMVQLKECIVSSLRGDDAVSIPLWYN